MRFFLFSCTAARPEERVPRLVKLQRNTHLPELRLEYIDSRPPKETVQSWLGT